MTAVEAPLSEKTKKELEQALAGLQDATFELLAAKPRRKTTFVVAVLDGEGQPRQVKITYQAMDPTEYDDLISAHPPTPKAQRQGHQWNNDTFPPALISAVSLTPKLTVDQATQLLKSPNWSTGEIDALFSNAILVCKAGLDVPFNDGD